MDCNYTFRLLWYQTECIRNAMQNPCKSKWLQIVTFRQGILHRQLALSVSKKWLFIVIDSISLNAFYHMNIVLLGLRIMDTVLVIFNSRVISTFYRVGSRLTFSSILILLYLPFIFYLPRCPLPELFALTSIAPLPYSSWCHLTTTYIFFTVTVETKIRIHLYGKNICSYS